IRWCLELPAPLLENFDVGTHFLEERQAFEHYPLPDEAYACDLCGVNVAMECACYFEGAVCLCPSCHKYLARITDGAVKDGIRKFLVGNVL
ncbi:MAG TPA: hypothetical protein VLT88_16835, partial [Desulfosarcina sp.]|nr:hypothetical protein [Desulfosarcina sp.]